jgi:hypothetical protein
MSKVLFIHAADKDGHRAVHRVVKWGDVIHVQTLISLKKNEKCEDAELSVPLRISPAVCSISLFLAEQAQAFVIVS